MALCLRRVQYRARRQVYDIEVETSPYKPLEDQIPVVDSVLQNPEIQAVSMTVLLLPFSAAAEFGVCRHLLTLILRCGFVKGTCMRKLVAPALTIVVFLVD